MSEVEPEGSEPSDVDDQQPDAAECLLKKEVCLLRSNVSALEPLYILHLSPEVSEVECDESENDHSENEHVL